MKRSPESPLTTDMSTPSPWQPLTTDMSTPSPWQPLTNRHPTQRWLTLPVEKGDVCHGAAATATPQGIAASARPEPQGGGGAQLADKAAGTPCGLNSVTSFLFSSLFQSKRFTASGSPT